MLGFAQFLALATLSIVDANALCLASLSSLTLLLLSSSSSLPWDQVWRSNLKLKLPASTISQRARCTKKVWNLTADIGHINPNKTKYLFHYRGIRHTVWPPELKKKTRWHVTLRFLFISKEPPLMTIKVGWRFVNIWQDTVTSDGIKVGIF